jgi:hypothetical protein
MWLDSVTSFSYKFAFVLQMFQLSFLLQVVENNASTEYVLTGKTITPMGQILRSGEVKNDFIMMKGYYMGPKNRAITLLCKVFDLFMLMKCAVADDDNNLEPI